MQSILLVDDEPWFTAGLAAALEARGFGCIIATNMTDGVRVLRENNIKVVVTDIMMPSGDAFKNIEASETGFHFIQYVQSHWPGLAIVCLSVVADQAKIRLLQRKKVRYLRKGETTLSTAIEVISAACEGRVIRLGG